MSFPLVSVQSSSEARREYSRKTGESEETCFNLEKNVGTVQGSVKASVLVKQRLERRSNGGVAPDETKKRKSSIDLRSCEAPEVSEEWGNQ